MTEVFTGLAAGDRERVAALRAEGRFFWLDASRSETSRDELVDALGVPEGALEERWRRASAPTRSPSTSRFAAMSRWSARARGLRTDSDRFKSRSW